LSDGADLRARLHGRGGGVSAVEAEAPPLADATIEALAGEGPLAAALAGFVPRPSQQALAAAVAAAFEGRENLLAEAGTGTGTTFAYVVPALLSGLKTIVSTGTRALQDQLYHRDLPAVRDALGTGLRAALLKGRANYLCRHRLERARGEPRLSGREQVAMFERIVAWAGRTRMGDLAELEALPEGSPLIPMVTSTVDNCLGSECPFWNDCFVVEARQRAQSADLVVVNHHLLLADLALKQEGFGEILPGAQAFVVDEAHQLPELAAQFFGEALSARPLVELARDALVECADVPGALRSEEHTSELQSRENLVCRLLLERRGHHRYLHSLPTRRSSDLPGAQAGGLRRDPAGRAGVRGRRGAPAAGAGGAVLRRGAERSAAGGAGARCAGRMRGRARRA